MHTRTTHAQIEIDASTRSRIHDRVFGSFVEHLGRTVYTGIYEPEHATADAAGFRGDVAELTKDLGVTTVRYPGGNFVSAYRWEDGIGPREKRPRRFDPAWRRIESNQVGTDDFLGWCERLQIEPMLVVNLGTRGIEAASDLVEYTNFVGGTAISDMRRANGRDEPWNVQMWCLGNEMDGPWQIGHKTAREYGRLAAEAGRAMKRVDPSIQLVACGSSGRQMPTFGEWERTVLEETWDVVDFLSLHAYYEEKHGDRRSFLASGELMHRFIRDVVEIVDEVGAARGSEKQINLSFDEWNVWYLEDFHGEDTLPTDEVAPLFEDRHSSLDAVVLGDLLIALLRNADRVQAASLAQLVNSLAPALTEPGGPAWRQSTFYPFRETALAALGGTALSTDVTGPEVETADHGAVPAISAVAIETRDGRLVLLVTNRADEPATLDVTVGGVSRNVAGIRSVTAGYDDRWTGTTDAPTGQLVETQLAELPPESWSIIELRD